MNSESSIRFPADFHILQQKKNLQFKAELKSKQLIASFQISQNKQSLKLLSKNFCGIKFNAKQSNNCL